MFQELEFNFILSREKLFWNTPCFIFLSAVFSRKKVGGQS